MVCAYVRESNPRALASGLSPVHTRTHTITALLHQHAMDVVKCEIFDVEHWNIGTLEYHSKVKLNNVDGLPFFILPSVWKKICPSVYPMSNDSMLP